MKRNSKKRLSLVLSMMMIATSINLTTSFSYAQNDIKNHWAKDTLTKWQQEGLLKGDINGNLNPDNSITRAEFMTMVNKAMNYNKQGDKINAYKDVKKQDWFYNEVMTALEQGYISGTSKDMVSPKSKITRQEVMVIINKIAQAQNTSNFDITKVNDNDKIAPWAKQASTNMIANGYIAGYQGNINPTKDMKRAEAVVLLDAYKQNNRTLSFEGNYSLGEINKLTIIAGNVKLKDTKIKDLIIDEKAKGKIELEKVEITGKTTNKSKEIQLYLNGEKVEIKDGKIDKSQAKEETAKYKDGEYEGKASGYGGDIKVKVTIKDGKIAKIDVIEQKEDAIYWNAAKKVIDRIIEKQETNVDTSAGATISSKGIMFAVEDALKKAENKKEEVKPKEEYKDGEYIGESGGFSGTVKVKVTIKEGKIEELEVIQHSDDDPYMQSAKNLISKIKEKQNPDVDIISGATYSSQGIINATKDALEQAKGKTTKPGQSEHALKNLSGGGGSGGTNSEIIQQEDFTDLKDGEYIAIANGHYSNSIKVRVTVKGHKIVKIELIENKDDKSYFDDTKAQKIAKQIIEKQSTKGVDTISKATNSSKGFINAVVEALKQAGFTSKIDRNYDGQNKELNKVEIVAKDLTIKNLTVKDDLVVTDKVGDGNLTLENITIKGNLIINGGGENSIHLKNVQLEKQIEINKEQGQRVRVVLEQGTTLKEKLTINTPTIIQTKEEVTIPTIEISKSLDSNKQTEIQAKTDKLDIKSNKVNITIKKDSKIKHIELPNSVDKYDKDKKEYIKDKFKLIIEGDTKIDSGSNNNVISGGGGGSGSTAPAPEQDFTDLKDGVYEASARGHNAPDSIKVRVTVQGSKIVKIELIDNKDDKPYFDDTKAEKIAKQIIEKQSTKGVDTISEATNSSKGFINAVVQALKQAGYVTKINANFDGQNKSLNEVLITAKDIEVKNLTVKDDLIVTEQVGDGNLTLENLIIKGNLIIQGGGENSIYLKNVQIDKQIEIDKKQGSRVRVVLEKGTKLQDKLVVKTSSIIQTKDEVKIPTIELSKALDEGRETQIQAKTDKLDIQTDKTKILVQKGSEIKHIELPSNIDNYDKNKKEYIKDNFKLTIEDNTKIESGSNENIKGEFEFLSKSEVEELDNGKVYPDGIYYGDAIGYRKFKPTPVKLTIKDGKIFNVERFSSETRKLKAIPYPDVIDDGDKYDRAFDEIVNKIKSEQKPLELSYKLKVLTDVTEKIMQEVDGKTPSIQAYNKAFDKIIGKHNFGKNNKQFTMSEFSNKDNVRSAIIDLVEIYVKDELGYDMEFLDTVAGATYSSKGTALAVKNALKRTKSDVDVVDMRVIHNYKDSYIENELLDLSGLQAELYKKTQSGKIQKVTIPYSEFKQNGLKVVFRDTTKEIPDKLKLNNESLGHSILNGLELSVLHPKSYGIKLLNNINIKSDLITYKVSKIQIREKSSSDKWIDLKFETYIGNTGNVFEYIKYIELDKADFNKLIGKSVEFQVIATTKDGKNEKVFPTTNSKELIWPNFLSYGHSIYISEKEFLDENGKEKIRLEEGRTLKLHLKEQKTLASEFKETPKSINITTKTMLTADDIKTAFTTDLSTIVKNIEFDDTIDVTTEKKIDINVKLIFTDDSQKAFKIRLIVENPSSEADKYIVRLNPVSTTTSNMLDIEATKKIVKNAFVGLPNTAEIELKDTNKNYFEIEKVVEIPVIVRFKDGSTKEVNVPVTVKNTLNKAEQYQIEDYTQVNIKMVPSPESAVGPSSESLLKIFKSNLEEVSNSDNLKDNLIYALSIYEKQNKYGQINIDITSQPDRTKLGKTSGKARFTFDDNSSVEFDIPVEIIPFKLQYVPTSVRYPNIEYLLGDQVDLTKMEIISAVLSEKQNGEWKPNKAKTLLIPYQDFKLFGIDVISKHHNSEFENNTVLTRDYIEYNEKSKRYIIGLQLYHKEPTPREEQENGEIYIDIKNIKLKKFADMYKEEYPNTETVSIVPSTTLYTGRPNALNSTANAGKFDLRNIKRQLKIAEKEYKYGDISIELLDDSSIDNTKMGEQQQGKIKLIFTDKSELELDVPVIVKPFPIVTFSAQIGKMQKKYDLNSPIDLNNLQVFAKISENIDVRTGTWSQRGTTLPISYSEFGAFGLKVVKRNTTQEIKNGTIITQDIVNNDNEITLDIYSQEPTIGETIYPSTNVVQIEGLTIK